MTLRMRQILMDKQGGDGGAGGGGGAAADDKGGAPADKGGAPPADDKGGAPADDKGGAPAQTDWRSAIAGEDAAVLETLKGIEDPKVLLDAHSSQVNWRQTLAGDNKDALKTLERFASPKALWDSYEALRGRMAKGELRNATPFPEKGTAEQQAAWRAENNVPDAPEKYEVKLPDGVDPEVVDKARLTNFTKFAHGKNLPAGVVADVIAFEVAEGLARQEAAQQKFENMRTETAATLGAEWGPEYKGTMNRIQGMIDATVPADQQELKDLIDRALSTNAHFARHYAALALQINPVGTLVSGDRGANEGSITDAIKAIEADMRKNRAKYDRDEAMQKKYRDHLAAYEKLTGKRWGQE